MSQYPGYLPTNQDVSVGDTDTRANIEVLVDPSTCAAKGYSYHYDGTSEAFTGWTGSTPQDGWTGHGRRRQRPDVELRQPGEPDAATGVRR